MLNQRDIEGASWREISGNLRGFGFLLFAAFGKHLCESFGDWGLEMQGFAGDGMVEIEPISV